MPKTETYRSYFFYVLTHTWINTDLKVEVITFAWLSVKLECEKWNKSSRPPKPLLRRMHACINFNLCFSSPVYYDNVEPSIERCSLQTRGRSRIQRITDRGEWGPYKRNYFMTHTVSIFYFLPPLTRKIYLVWVVSCMGCADVWECKPA